MPCQLPEQYMHVSNQTLNCFPPVAHFKSKLLCLEPDRPCFLHPCVWHLMWSECENGMLTSGSLETKNHIAKRPALVSFCVLRPVGSNMSCLTQGIIEPFADPSIDLASQFSAVDNAPSKHKRKRGDAAKGKDAF